MIAAIAIFALKRYQPQLEPSLSPIAQGSCHEDTHVRISGLAGACNVRTPGPEQIDELEQKCNSYCANGVASSQYTCYGKITPEDQPYCFSQGCGPSYPPYAECHYLEVYCSCNYRANPTPSPSSSASTFSSPKLA